MDNPITVGGGIIFGPFNEQFYLSHLLDFNGAPVSFRRGSTVTGGPDNHILDPYQIDVKNPDMSFLIFFDVYTPGVNGIPSGFRSNIPLDAWNLPRSTVKSPFPDESYVSCKKDERRWKLFNKTEEVGLAFWDGSESIELHMGHHTKELVMASLNPVMELTPIDHIGEVLEDFFERFLPITSHGLIQGRHFSLPKPPQWNGNAWGEGT